MDAKEIFVLVLQLDQYQGTNLMEQDICGRSVAAWVETAVAPFPHRFIPASAKDDILTLFRANLTNARYTVVTYADLPLLTSDSIWQAVDYCAHKQASAVQLPRGWVFQTALVAQTSDFPVTPFAAAEPSDYLVAFNQSQIAKIRSLQQERLNQTHLRNGVNIIDPDHTYLDVQVQLAPGCTIEPNTHLAGNTTVATGTTILQGCQIDQATIGANCQVGPFAHIRPGCTVGDDCRIGNFVELKRSRIGNGTKIAHMTYVGDSQIGANCNIGCGVIFCNYDGKKKSQTLVGDQVFVGSNTCLIAPVEIGDRAFIAAGSVISEKLPAKALGIARARQAIKENYVTE